MPLLIEEALDGEGEEPLVGGGEEPLDARYMYVNWSYTTHRRGTTYILIYTTYPKHTCTCIKDPPKQ